MAVVGQGVPPLLMDWSLALEDSLLLDHLHHHRRILPHGHMCGADEWPRKQENFGKHDNVELPGNGVIRIL